MVEEMVEITTARATIVATVTREATIATRRQVMRAAIMARKRLRPRKQKRKRIE